MKRLLLYSLCLLLIFAMGCATTTTTTTLTTLEKIERAEQQGDIDFLNRMLRNDVYFEEAAEALGRLMADKLQDVEVYKGSLYEKNKFALTDIKVLSGGGGTLWRGVTNIAIQGEEKHFEIYLDGYGTFDYDFTEGCQDPLFGITFPNDEEWHIVKGFTFNGGPYGSWGFLLPGKVDLTYPPGTFRGCARMIKPIISFTGGGPMQWPDLTNTFMPLTELGLTPDGKISVLRFSNSGGEIVLYVPGRRHH